MTVWNGMCLKIKFEYFSLDLAPTFNVAFSKSLSLADVPTPEVYLTSEENAYGIINYGWVNGEELKIVLEGVEQVLLSDLSIDITLRLVSIVATVFKHIKRHVDSHGRLLTRITQVFCS